MVLGFKSFNFVHSASTRPFVLRFWPFQFPSRRHLEMWCNCVLPCPGPLKIVQRKMAAKESSESNLLASSRNIGVIISQNEARMKCNWVRMSKNDVSHQMLAVCKRPDSVGISNGWLGETTLCPIHTNA